MIINKNFTRLFIIFCFASVNINAGGRGGDFHESDSRDLRSECFFCNVNITTFPEKTLACGHNIFHARYFRDWLRSQKETRICPICPRRFNNN